MHSNASIAGPARPLVAAAGLTALWMAVALATSAFSCSTGPNQDPEIDDPDAFWVDATVGFTPVEGGCWKLVVDDTSYEPIGLDEEFREDGLAVRAALKARPDLASICMVGQLVEVLSIRVREGG